MNELENKLKEGFILRFASLENCLLYKVSYYSQQEWPIIVEIFQLMDINGSSMNRPIYRECYPSLSYAEKREPFDFSRFELVKEAI